MNSFQWWFDAVVKVLALVVGAFWVLFNYYRGRTHKARLRLRVFAKRTSLDGLEFLIIRTELSNVGRSRVDASTGCHLTLYTHQLPQKHINIVMEPRWEKLAVYDLYQDQRWIEPGGLLIDQRLVAVPGLTSKYLRVWAHFESPTVGLNASAIVSPTSQNVAMTTRASEANEKAPHY